MQEKTPVTMSVALQQTMLPPLPAMDATKKGMLSSRRFPLAAWLRRQFYPEFGV
jgi:hypothetical protein